MRRTHLALLATSLMLTGCADVLNSLLAGADVTGAVRMPSTQTAGIFAGIAYRISATIPGEVVVKGATVQATTPAGASVGSGATTTTDSLGYYDLKGVPSGHTNMLVGTLSGNGKTLKVEALVKPNGTSSVRDLNVASTIVAEKLRTLGATRLDALQQTDLDTLEGLIAANLANADVPNLSDSNAVLAAFDKVMQANTEVASRYGAIAGTGVSTAAVR